jgi:hypothetical protein
MRGGDGLVVVRREYACGVALGRGRFGKREGVHKRCGTIEVGRSGERRLVLHYTNGLCQRADLFLNIVDGRIEHETKSNNRSRDMHVTRDALVLSDDGLNNVLYSLIPQITSVPQFFFFSSCH